MRLQLQSEASECALACLAMVLDHFGSHVKLAELRRQCSVSLKGATLLALTRHAGKLKLTSRPLRLELDEFERLARPCILHWDLDHFVVLAEIRRSFSGRQIFKILDPAIGERHLTLAEISKHFTGVAVELTPSQEFSKQKSPTSLRLSELTGKVFGLKRGLLQVFALALALELVALAMPLFNQFVVDEVIRSGDRELLRVLMVGFVILIATQTAISLVRSWVLMRWTMQISLQWSIRVFHHMIRLPVSYFEKRHIGDIVSRFGSISAIQSTLTGILVESAIDGILASLALVMMYLYSPILSSIVIGAICAYAVLRWIYYGPLRADSAERMVLAAKEGSHFIETLRSVTPLKLYGQEEHRRTRWQNLLVDVQNRDIKTQRLVITSRVANTTIFSIQGLASFYVGAGLVMGGEMTVGMLMAFTSYSATFTGRMFALIDMFVGFKMLSLHCERLADIVHETPELIDDVNETIPAFEQAIELRGVSFRYADGEPWALRDVSLSIRPGDSVALVGPSGCGKSTLCKLMLGLLPPTEGDILVDGVSLKRTGLASYRRMVGTVMQDDTLVSGTIYDNITFFCEKSDKDEVHSAAARASIHTDILAMPMGYQTLIGEMGGCLSGGQRQRVLLARAFYKKPQLLCLDEATSHLDVENERAILDCLKGTNITRIMVAHRPDAIQHAARVITLRNGRVQSDVVNGIAKSA